MRKHIMMIVLAVSTVLTARAQQNDQYTVIISLDGCRWDYPQWYDTPFFDQMAKDGIEAGLIPSFPSKTFPNHYTLATGLYPDHHGIIANTFFDPDTGRKFSLGDSITKFDPRYYGGEPVWITAQRQGLRSAVFYWPGSDVKIKGVYPWHYHNYDEKPHLSFEERIDGIIQMLKMPEQERPRLIMAYFEQPDGNGHRYGPQSKYTRDAVEKIDAQMRQLYEGIQQLPIADKVNFIITSDHGMTTLAEDRLVDLRPIIKPQWIVAAEGSVPTNIYCKEGCADSVFNALRNVDHIKYWRKADIPEYLHYGTNPREGEIVVMPDLGWMVADKLGEWGSHGFDPEFNDMHAMFRAIGPAFKKGYQRPHFRNVNVYALLCHLLGIAQSQNDGSLDEIRDILKD